MKILIYIPIADAKNGTINPKDYHIICPQAGYQNYVQVLITSDEFARLEDDTNEKYMSELEERIYEESQKITGGEFEKWYMGLSHEERSAYKTVFGN